MCANQTDLQTDRLAGRQADRWHTYRQTYTQTDSQTHIHTYRHTDTYRERQIHPYLSRVDEGGVRQRVGLSFWPNICCLVSDFARAAAV